MITRPLLSALTLCIAFIATAKGLRYAADVGLIDPETARRVVQTLIGLGLAAYANTMPKQLGAEPAAYPPHARAQARALAVLRVGGWAFTLAGLAYAAVWAFAPVSVARAAGTAGVLTALSATLAYALRCVLPRRTA